MIANSLDAEFFHLSWVLSKKEDVVKIIGKAQKNYNEWQQTILFLDEIHRWTKSQQDVLLPWVEKGIVTLIGATTENPSFTVINALLSRCRTYILEPIKPKEVEEFLMKNLRRIEERYPKIVFFPDNKQWNRESEGAILSERRWEQNNDERKQSKREFIGPSGAFGTFQSWKVPSFELIAKLGWGDLRNTLNLLETACILQGEGELTRENILEAWSKSLMYDQDGEEHYNLISAMHKSLRDSDWDAAIYWIGRMLAWGEDPRYIARRMINFASEDVYSPEAIMLTNSVYEICEKMGMPECELPLINAAYFLADLPKDNRVYMAMQAMHADVREFWNLGVPLHLRNAPTELMKEAGYGKGYEYAHNLKEKKSTQEHLPKELQGRRYRGSSHEEKN